MLKRLTVRAGKYSFFSGGLIFSQRSEQAQLEAKRNRIWKGFAFTFLKV